MKLYGYARVSTADQDLTIQRKALEEAGCHVIRSEKVFANNRQDCVELDTLLNFLREGDVLVVTRIDRLARSVKDLGDIVAELKDKKAMIRCIEQPVDTTMPAGKAFLDMLGVFTDFETAIRRERQIEGIAKTQGVYLGRKKVIDHAAVKVRFENGMRPAEIARELGASRQSVYLALNAEGIEYTGKARGKA